MTFSKSLLFFVLGGSFTYASSLSVYQDNSYYTFTPENNFIGFAQNINVKCKGNTLPIREMTLCPSENRLCKLLTKVEQLEERKDTIEANIKVLEQLITLPQPNNFDAVAWIEAAKLTGEEEVRLSHKVIKLKHEINIAQNNFRKQAPSKTALKTEKNCSNDIEVTIPYGIHFSTQYEANIIDEKKIEVTQYLSLLNSSGIDIQVDSANFYYRLSKQYIHPIHFNPWVVSKYEPSPKRMYKKSMAKSKPMKEMSVIENGGTGGDIVPIEAIVSYEDAREYKIENLTLPSTGIPMNVELLSWKAPIACSVYAYPYINTRAFHVCSFTPKFQIDTNQWKIKSDNKMLNENAIGEYKNGQYNLYTKVEDDIQIRRLPIVKKERETGIFGGTARKKDGYTIILTNKSNKKKILRVIDRIPTSTTETIKSKLLSVKSKNKIDYKELKDGKIEMNIVLKENETKEIEILFEISYDKNLKVNY